MNMVSGASVVPAIGLLVFVACLPLASCADKHDLSDTSTDSVSTTQDYDNDNWIQGSGTGTSDSNTPTS
jgi:hypothetical protein